MVWEAIAGSLASSAASGILEGLFGDDDDDQEDYYNEQWAGLQSALDQYMPTSLTGSVTGPGGSASFQNGAFTGELSPELMGLLSGSQALSEQYQNQLLGQDLASLAQTEYDWRSELLNENRGYATENLIEDLWAKGLTGFSNADSDGNAVNPWMQSLENAFSTVDLQNAISSIASARDERNALSNLANSQGTMGLNILNYGDNLMNMASSGANNWWNAQMNRADPYLALASGQSASNMQNYANNQAATQDMWGSLLGNTAGALTSYYMSPTTSTDSYTYTPWGSGTISSNAEYNNPLVYQP